VQRLVHVSTAMYGSGAGPGLDRTKECTATPTLQMGRHTLSSGWTPNQADAQIIAVRNGGAAVGLHDDTVGSVGKRSALRI